MQIPKNFVQRSPGIARGTTFKSASMLVIAFRRHSNRVTNEEQNTLYQKPKYKTLNKTGNCLKSIHQDVKLPQRLHVKKIHDGLAPIVDFKGKVKLIVSNSSNVCTCKITVESCTKHMSTRHSNRFVYNLLSLFCCPRNKHLHLYHIHGGC